MENNIQDEIIKALKAQRDEYALMIDISTFEMSKNRKIIKKLRRKNCRLSLALGIETLAIFGYLYYRLDKRDKEYQNEIEEAMKEDEFFS